MILIKELLPNPTGSDEKGEWIRLINDGDESASSKGLSLADESGKTFSLSAVEPIAPGETVELGRPLTKITLNNDGDTVFLRASNGEVIDELTYARNISEGEIVTADKFIPQAPAAANSLPSRQAGFGATDYSPGLAPVAVGLMLALVAGALAWYVVGKIYQEENEKIYD
ncbi:MAG: lamin tail domain-containing protein [bacterium]|nr:lamin tail domain-containing protein [bacterium]MDZ4231244.1 lamin tail domain-containing protein [Patescibacteria group bacterium]